MGCEGLKMAVIPHKWSERLHESHARRNWTQHFFEDERVAWFLAWVILLWTLAFFALN